MQQLVVKVLKCLAVTATLGRMLPGKGIHPLTHVPRRSAHDALTHDMTRHIYLLVIASMRAPSRGKSRTSPDARAHSFL